MSRRYALLDDNDAVLAERIEQLRAALPRLISSRMCAAMVIGSVAAGNARDHSDLDVLLVLSDDSPKRTDYVWWDADVEPRLHFSVIDRFPIQPVIVSRGSLRTTEPNLREAAAQGIPIWDPEALFR